jgi:hypothetical protein
MDTLMFSNAYETNSKKHDTKGFIGFASNTFRATARMAAANEGSADILIRPHNCDCALCLSVVQTFDARSCVPGMRFDGNL